LLFFCAFFQLSLGDITHCLTADEPITQQTQALICAKLLPDAALVPAKSRQLIIEFKRTSYQIGSLANSDQPSLLTAKN